MHALKSNLKPAKALKARASIAKTLHGNHTRYVHAYPTFRIPCSTIENSEIRELIYYTVHSVNHDEELQHLLLSNTRILSMRTNRLPPYFIITLALRKRTLQSHRLRAHVLGTLISGNLN